MVVGAIVVFKLLVRGGFFFFLFYSLYCTYALVLDAPIDDSLSKSSVNTFILDTVREGINRKVF
jgi:hypothetical protein